MLGVYCPGFTCCHSMHA